MLNVNQTMGVIKVGINLEKLLVAVSLSYDIMYGCNCPKYLLIIEINIYFYY